MILQNRLAGIRAVVMDVDGVLTDGRIGYGCGSEEEIKFFHVRDGSGLNYLRRSGILVGALSGRASAANRRRLLEELHFDQVMEGCHFKADGFRELCGKLKVNPEECMYIGDDLIDLPPMRMAGISVAVGDAVPEVKEAADWIMTHAGGQGAVREAAERFLKARGLWDKIMERYL